jgi:hypothetical protein
MRHRAQTVSTRRRAKACCVASRSRQRKPEHVACSKKHDTVVAARSYVYVDRGPVIYQNVAMPFRPRVCCDHQSHLRWLLIYAYNRKERLNPTQLRQRTQPGASVPYRTRNATAAASIPRRTEPHWLVNMRTQLAKRSLALACANSQQTAHQVPPVRSPASHRSLAVEPITSSRAKDDGNTERICAKTWIISVFS